MKEESFAGAGKDLPLTDESQFVEEVRIGSTFLTTAAEIYTPEQRSFLKTIFQKCSLHEDVETRLQYLRLIGKEEYPGTNRTPVILMQHQSTEIFQPIGNE